MNILDLLGGIVKIAQVSLDNAWRAGHFVGYNEAKAQSYTEGWSDGYAQAQQELGVHRLEVELT